jgi:Predicted transcriptional regulators
MTMGDRLRALRLQRKISQGEVARYIGITRSAYSHYEINNRQPVYDTLIKLSAYFDVSLDYIIGGSTSTTKLEAPDAPETNEVLALLRHMNQEQRMQSIRLLRDLIRHRSEDSG